MVGLAQGNMEIELDDFVRKYAGRQVKLPNIQYVA